MDRVKAEELRSRLEVIFISGWRERDPDVKVTSVVRADNKIDMMVVSKLFVGKDGLQREASFWPFLAQVPRHDVVHMTYCLLLTPDEADRSFAQPSQVPESDMMDAWSE